jgi:tyrosine-protein kinase Etk/Wzc
LLIGLGLALGFATGAGIVLVRRMLLSGVEDPKVVETELGLPVYASIAHSQVQEQLNRQMRHKAEGIHLLAKAAPDELAMESFRSLRTTLHFSMLDAPNKILLLVGPSPTIGKSFVSGNFAATLAMAGHKVLLMDADLRRGHIHQYLGMPRGAGLSDVLSGTVPLDGAIHGTGIDGLSFLSTGTIPPNPSELLLHENFAHLLEELKPRFDYIVIDSAPVLAVTDAVILGKLAGTTLMVLKHGRHPMAEIEACQARLSQAGVALKGVVFNDVVHSGGAYAYRYGAAAYQCNYTKG